MLRRTEITRYALSLAVAHAALLSGCGDDGSSELDTDAVDTETDGQSEGTTGDDGTQADDAADDAASDSSDGQGDDGDGPNDGGTDGDGKDDGAADEGTGTEGTDDATDDDGAVTPFELTIFHNNDGESDLLPFVFDPNGDVKGDEIEYGGVSRFRSLIEEQRAAAEHSITLSSGDNFLAGPEFSLSLELPEGTALYDSDALDRIGYDAMCLGNHDFDFGAETLARFIGGFQNPTAFLSANLDFSASRPLQTLVEAGVIAGSTVVDVDGEQIGVVGATTPQLALISSPGAVEVDANVAMAIQDEIDALEADGVNKIIVISHLQSIGEDLELATVLTGADVIIAGGGDELLANDDTVLLPVNDADDVFDTYPVIASDGTPVVTTNGSYRYLGRLIVTFDEDGEIIEVSDDSDSLRVIGGDSDDAVEPDEGIEQDIIAPIEAGLDALGEDIVGTSAVQLDGLRANVRVQETNFGNLIADALMWQANQLNESYDAPAAAVAIQNGGGIRNDSVLEPGELSVLTTFDALPFTNFVTIVHDVTPAQLRQLLEIALRRLPGQNGGFAQVSGMEVRYDVDGEPADIDGDGTIVVEGTRVRSVVVTYGDDDDSNDIVLVEDGTVLDGAPDVAVATINFIAGGGDGYPLGDNERTQLPVTYQGALAGYIRFLQGEAGEEAAVTDDNYPTIGEGRVGPVADVF